MQHKFHLGQMVIRKASSLTQIKTAEPYTITRLLPGSANTLSYRIKSTSEPHERVVSEYELTLVRTQKHDG